MNAGYRLAHLNRYFGATKLVDIDAAAILGYVTHRKGQGRANATINVELATLRRALRLAQEYGKLDKVPVIRMLKPAQPRNGFFEREQFEAVAQALPADLALVARIGCVYGWRLRSEMLTLTKERFDLEVGTLRLEPGSTNNRDGRLVYLTSELKAGIADQMARVYALERETGKIVPFLFPHLGGSFKGRRVKNFFYTWRRACRQAGCPGMLRHDLRRSVARGLINAGVPERVAMAVTGHKTISMLHRYCIVSPADLHDVARRLSSQTPSYAPTPHVQYRHSGPAGEGVSG